MPNSIIIIILKSVGIVAEKSLSMIISTINIIKLEKFSNCLGSNSLRIIVKNKKTAREYLAAENHLFLL